jgi:hypothetical protein
VAELLMRVFRKDVLACPCGGRRVVLAYLTQPGPVKAILDHLGLPSIGPPIAPARFNGGLAEATWEDDVPTLQANVALKADPAPPLVLMLEFPVRGRSIPRPRLVCYADFSSGRRRRVGRTAPIGPTVGTSAAR